MGQQIATQADFIARLRRAYEGELETYLTQMIGSADIVRSLVDSSFERVRRSHPERAVFPRALLFQVATNFALMHLRSRRMGQPVVAADADFAAIPDAVAADQEERGEYVGAQIAIAVKTLRRPLRDVFVMAHVQGKRRSEIAAALGISERSVDKYMTAALKEARTHLSSYGIDLADFLGIVALLPLVYALSVH